MSSTIDPALAQEFGFDAADVAANRLGRLTPRQQARFANVASRGRHRVKMLVGLVCAMVAAAIVVALVASNTEVTPGLIAAVVGIALVPVVGVLVVSRSIGTTLTAFDDPRVASTEGRPTWEDWLSDGVHLLVGDVTFNVYMAEAELFDPQRTYRVHYVVTGASTQSVLSVEVIG